MQIVSTAFSITVSLASIVRSRSAKSDGLLSQKLYQGGSCGPRAPTPQMPNTPYVPLPTDLAPHAHVYARCAQYVAHPI